MNASSSTSLSPPPPPPPSITTTNATRSTFLFFKVWRNKFLNSIIFKYINSINHFYDYSEYFLYYNNNLNDNKINNTNNNNNNDDDDIDTIGFNENDYENELYFIYDDILELKSKLKILKYSEANDFLWLVRNKHFQLLKDKLVMHKKIIQQHQEILINNNNNNSNNSISNNSSNNDSSNNNLNNNNSNNLQSNNQNNYNKIKLSFNNDIKNFKLNITENSIYNFCFQNRDVEIFKLFYEIYGSEYFCTENTRIMEKVVKGGNLEIVKYLIKNGFKFDTESIHYSISFGYFKIFKYLIELIKCNINNSIEYKDLTPDIIDFARSDPAVKVNKISGEIKLKNVGIKILNYINEIYPNIEYSQQAVDYSCVSGNLEMIKFYKSNKGLVPSEKGIQGAIIGNHLNLLRYFKENEIFKDEDTYSFGIDQAIKEGHLESIVYMYNTLNRKWSENGIFIAAKYSRFEILLYMFSVDPELFKSKLSNVNILKKACSGGDLNTIDYLVDLGFAPSELMMISAAKKSNIKLIQYIFNQFKTSIPFSNKTIEYSIQFNNFEMFKVLTEIKDKYKIILIENNLNILNNNNNNNNNSNNYYQFNQNQLNNQNLPIIINNYNNDILVLNKYVLQCIRNRNLEFLKNIIEHFQNDGLKITTRKDNILLFAAQHDFSIVKYLLTLPGFKVTPNIILASKDRRIAKYLYSVYDGHLPVGLVFENLTNHYNLNLLKYHIQKFIEYKKSIGEVVNVKSILSDKEISKIASIPNNENSLKYIHKYYQVQFSNKSLRESCISNSIENVRFINEILKKNQQFNSSSGSSQKKISTNSSSSSNSTMTSLSFSPKNSLSSQDHIIDSAIDNLEIVKYLTFNSNQKCSTKAIEEAAHLENYMTVKFLLENRTEGYTNLAQIKAKSFPSILKLLNDHIDLLKKY